MPRHRAFGVALSVLFASSLVAQQRTFVSAQHGSDTNPCSLASPCRTFAAAISVTASGGEVIALDSGGYGPFTVSKAVSVEVPGGVYAGISAPSGDGIDVSAGGSDVVVLRGLTINSPNGSGTGINFTSGAVLHVENCVVSGFIGGGIAAQAPGSTTFVDDTISRDNGTGIFCLKGTVSIDHSRFENIAGDGVDVDGADVTVRESVSSGNTADGFYVTSSGSASSVLNVYQCMASHNGGNGLSSVSGSSSVKARVANSSMSENSLHGLLAGSGTTFQSLGDNFVEGNGASNTSGTITIVSGQ
jgi:hypothetical protein